MRSWIDRLHGVYTKDEGGRGLGDAVGPENLSDAIERLVVADRVLLMTGFFIADAMAGETDGPPGTVSLASALLRLGKSVRILTDAYSQSLVSACAEVLDCGPNLEIVSIDRDTASTDYRHLVEAFSPDAIVSIERPGMNRDGKCLSMSRVDLSAHVPCFDPVFHTAKQMGIPTIAIGDGANELGMGSLPRHVLRKVPHGEEIAAVTDCDHLIVAGVSNWGGAALVAGMSCRIGKNLLHTAEEERSMVEAMVDVGGIDGKTKSATVSVDGIEITYHQQVVRDLQAIIASCM